MSTTDSARVLAQGPILLYDGECGVCSGSVQWILAHERSHHLRFAALQSELGAKLRERAKISDDVDSLIWVEQQGGEVRVRLWSSAIVSVLQYVGGPWRMLSCLRFVPRPIRDAAYRLFAKHRLKFAPTSCLIPPPETRPRFLSA